MKRNNSVVALTLVFMLGIFGCVNNSQSQTGGVQNLQQQDFKTILQQEKAIVMDVRTPGEVASGIIKGATVFADVNGSDFEAQIAKLDKSKAYIVYCRSGARSNTAANYMLQKGFKKVYNLDGGIMSWKGEISKP
jgi:rhodanese-related sulfurtransferase